MANMTLVRFIGIPYTQSYPQGLAHSHRTTSYFG